MDANRLSFVATFTRACLGLAPAVATFMRACLGLAPVVATFTRACLGLAPVVATFTRMGLVAVFTPLPLFDAPPFR